MNIECRCKCSSKTGQNVIDNLRLKFQSSLKATQDTVLSEGMEYSPPIRRTVITAECSRRSVTWKYFIRQDPISVEVCQKFFRDVFQVTQKRLRVIQQKVINRVDNFCSNRGKQPGSSRKLSEATYDLATEHLNTFPYCVSHNTANVKYLTNSQLTRKKLYHLFRSYYEQKMGEPLKMSVRAYMYFFKRSGFAVQKPPADIDDPCVPTE